VGCTTVGPPVSFFGFRTQATLPPVQQNTSLTALGHDITLATLPLNSAVQPSKVSPECYASWCPSFPEKEAKSVVPLRGRLIGCPNLGEADPGGVPSTKQAIIAVYILLFPEKEAKSVVPLRGRLIGSPNFGEADPGGVPSRKQAIIVVYILVFPEKEAKSVVPLRGRLVGSPNLGEADPGGSGGTKQAIVVDCILLFPEKEAKSVVPLRGRLVDCPNLGEADPGGWAVIVVYILLFPEFRFAEDWLAAQTSAKPTQGGLGGVPPRKQAIGVDCILLFPEKEAKKALFRFASR
jgi:hypothetical protein